MAGMGRFDVIVMADWSAASSPTTGKDSIWVAVTEAATGEVQVRNHPTRHAARTALAELLDEAAGRRVLVGFDVPFGYPAGSVRGLLGPAAVPNARTMWRHLARSVHDDERNRNDRFEVAAAMNRASGAASGPFWGRPRGADVPGLSPTKDHGYPVRTHAGPLEEFRACERALLDAGKRPFSVWQLAYAGAVGGQAIVGIPTVHALCRDPRSSRRALVWPFDTGLVRDPTLGRPDAIVFAEIWPGAFDLDLSIHDVRDAAQVIGTVTHLAALDAQDRLGRLFAPTVREERVRDVVAEEAWILGA